MHLLFVLLCLLLGAGAQAHGATAAAFETLQLIPKPQADLIAIIDGKGGAPLPEQWTIVVHDPQGASGVREYIIAGTEIISQRAVSQLAPSLTPADALEVENVKVFPPQLAGLAQLYAQTNGVALGALDYQLRKEGAEATPLWTVTCRDEAGAPLGVLVVTAANGGVVSHEGFAKEPSTAALQAVSEADAEFLASEEARNSDGSQGARKKTTSSKKTTKRGGNKGNSVSRSFRKVGGSLQKFFTGRDTISR